MPVQLPKELVELVEGGASIQVGTRDAGLRPECLRAVGAAVGADRSTLTVYVPAELAARTLANLEHNGAVAVTFSQISNHKSLQVKGKLITLRRSRKNERLLQERWLAAFTEQLHMTGFSRRLGRRLRYWPSLALELEIHELFAQTPGPGAGRRIEAGA
jgi:hypothetical protein